MASLFEQGLAHPESLIEDRPTGFADYVPTNFDDFHRGTVTIREALTQSLNVPAVVVLDAVGPARLLARLKRAAASPALPDLSAPGLAIGLGGLGLNLRDLVALYGAIARGERADEIARWDRRQGVVVVNQCRTASARQKCCLVCWRHPCRRTAATQRLARPDRLQNRNVIWLPRRLGDRF